jgi:transposase
LVVREGWKVADAARAVGFGTRAVELWLTKSQHGRKMAALQTRKAPGAKPKLDNAQKRRLARLLERGSIVAGFPGQLWTGPAVGRLIEREFGVSYHDQYLPRLLRSLGWTPQKPKRRARERDEGAVMHWVRRDWPRIKKRRDG